MSEKLSGVMNYLITRESHTAPYAKRARVTKEIITMVNGIGMPT